MTLRDRIPVEPLSDERVTNIERRVVVGASDALQRPVLERPRWVGFAAAAAFAVVVGVVGWRVGASRTGTNEIAAVEPIRIDTRERTTLDIGDAQITHDPNTQVVITRPAGGVLVDMTRGKVELEVGKRGTRPPLVVRAGDTDVVVVGTHFAVDYGDGTHAPTVTVSEGVVEVINAKQTVGRLAAGQAWTKSGGVVAASSLPPAVTAMNGDCASRCGPSGAGTTGTTTNTGTIASNPTTVPTNGDVALRDRQATAPTGTTPTGERSGSNATGSGSGERTGGKVKVVQYQTNLHKALRAQPITPAFDNGIEDPKQSIAEHYTVAAGRDDTAAARGETPALALYSIAVIQLLEQRDPAEALATLDRYLDRFQKKGDHADALWLRVRILCEVRFDERCRHAASVYAEKVPTGPKAGIANEVTAVHE